MRHCHATMYAVSVSEYCVFTSGVSGLLLRKVCRFLIVASFAIILAGCATSLARVPVPQALVETAYVRDLPMVRAWGDEVPKELDKIVELSRAQMEAHRPELRKPGSRPKFSYLAISGGGGDGAYGAGFLKGWTEAGTRPKFELVTGVSTGALIAPFAFLGPQYDHVLREVYTQYGTDDLLTKTPLLTLLGSAAVSNNSKFAGLIAKYVTQDFLGEIADEFNKGRRLLVGTTNLDAQRPVIWDMTQIAANGGPRALPLFRKILLASASIPGVFPPVLVDVEVDGKSFAEMHVDGGTTSEVFFLPTQIVFSSIDKKQRVRPQRTLFIIWNGKLQPEWQAVEADAFAVSARSLSTLIKNQGIGDLSRIYFSARRNKMSYRLTSFPPSFSHKASEPFDIEYMRKLYTVGYEAGLSGQSWTKSPPGL